VVVILKNIDFFPKSIVKAVRYIKQDADKDQLEEIKKLIDEAFKIRLKRS
jgi:hypothetical protein